jgi:hypothetical protein
MKLAISYKNRGSDYRITINVDKYSVYDELNKVLKTICERFDKIDEFRVHRIVEEIPLVKIIIPLLLIRLHNLLTLSFLMRISISL